MVQTSTWFGCGAALTLFLALLGILFTEVASKQANTPQATDFPALSDLVGILVIASLIAGCIAWLIACVSWCARDIGASSTLARVARDGAPHTAMPHPRQIASVTRPRFRESWWTLVVTAALTTVTALLMVVVLLSGPQGSLPIAVGFAVISVALWALFYVVHRVLPTRHMRRREVIASHWTAADETSAWSASRARSKDVGTDKGKRHPTLTHGKVLSGIAAAIGILVYLASFVVVLVYKPSKFSPERELSQPQDLMALRVMWVLLIMFAAAVVLVVIGLLLQEKGQRAEAAVLRSSTTDHAEKQPSRAMVAAHSTPYSPPWFRLLVTGASIGLCLGPVLLLADTSEGGDEVVVALRPLAIVATAVAVIVLAAAFLLRVTHHDDTMDLRNRLHVQYPLLPTASRDIWNEKVVPPARLHPQNDDDLTPGRRQDPSGDS